MNTPMTDQQSDLPGAEGNEIICPVCDSPNIEEIVDGGLFC